MKHETNYINNFNKQDINIGDLEFKVGEMELMKKIEREGNTTYYFEVRKELKEGEVYLPKLTMDKLKELTEDSSLVLRQLQKKTGLNTLELTDKIKTNKISIDILEGLG